MREMNVYVSENADPEPVLIVAGRTDPEVWTQWLSREEAEELARALREAGFTGHPPQPRVVYCTACHVQRGDAHDPACEFRGIY